MPDEDQYLDDAFFTRDNLLFGVDFAVAEFVMNLDIDMGEDDYAIA